MLNFLHYKNWSKLLDSESDYTNYLEQKRNVLFSQFCVIATISALIQGTYDLLDGYPFVMAIDMLFTAILVSGYFLNEKHKHTLAKMLVFISSNILLFSFAGVVPKGVGMYLLFYPLVAFSFIAFDFQHRKYSIGLVALSVVLNAILVLTNYQPFGNVNLQPTDPTVSFILNLLISIILLSMGIDFLLKINYTAENKLLKNQEQTEKLAQEINEKNLSLEKTNEELDRFVYSTSHDLRAPLASILGLINLTELEKEPIPPAIVRYLDMVRERVNSLDDFIKDIIDYSRNSRIDVILTDVNLPELVEEVIMNNRFLENAKKVKISSNIDIHEPLQLDKNRIFRILNNLVSNAIKYNDITKENPAVEISALIENTTLIIKVTDTGKGIREDIHDKVFDMFYRGTEDADGSGLGLYIAREMVQKMNGNLSFESNAGKGTTFSVKLPLTNGSTI